MRKVIYAMGVSLDGFIAGPDGEIDWSAPDEELHRFHNDQAREASAFLYGRRMYEIMAGHWPTAHTDASAAEHELEFARIWMDTPKIVFSTTLDSVDHNSTLVRDDVEGEVARLKRQPGNDMDVGGAGLAATLMRSDLIDEYRPFVYPVVLGGGTPYLPESDERIDLELVETRTFGGGVVYLRYARASTRVSDTGRGGTRQP